MQAHWENHLLALAGEPPHPIRRPARHERAGDLILRSAYRACAAITLRHSKSFDLAARLLPAPKRTAVRALYAFCRSVDDIVDIPGAGDRKRRLEAWRSICQGVEATSQDPVAVAWADTLARYHIPRQYALQLIDGVGRDLSGERYQTFDDLSTYCYGVASTVGLMSMYIVGFHSREALPYAIKLGVALQMTNILRDVGEDLRLGRLYLPLRELEAFGIREEDLQSGTVTERWRLFMRFQIERTRRLYDESRPGIAMLDRDGQLAILAASELYRGILEVIERNDYDVFTRRASLGAWEKLSRLPGLFLHPAKA